MAVAAGDRKRSLAPLLVLPAALLVLAVLGMPLLTLFRYSFNRFVPGQAMAEAFILDNYARFFQDPYFINVLWTTVQMAVVCTLLSLVLALAILRLVARRRGPGRAGAMVSGFSCLVLAGFWAFVAGFHVITG